MRPGELSFAALPPLPEVRSGDDLAALIAAVSPPDLSNGDVLVVAHKVVSKAEGRTVDLAGIQPSPRARSLAEPWSKDPRLVQVVLDESFDVLRAERGVMICRHHSGVVCANAGVDVSNLPGEDTALLLPPDPDSSARALRSRLGQLCARRPAVVVADSFGRPWRLGQTDVALGAAGLRVLDDWRGRTDHAGRELRATAIAVADSLAGAADLTRAKSSRQPAVLARGLDRFVTAEDGPGAAALRRPPADDLFG